MREKIETFVSAWEKKAKGSMHLDALLAKPIKEKLINGLVEIFEAEMEAKPKLTTAAIEAMRDDALKHDLKPDENGDVALPVTKPKRKGKAR